MAKEFGSACASPMGWAIMSPLGAKDCPHGSILMLLGQADIDFVDEFDGEAWVRGTDYSGGSKVARGAFQLGTATFLCGNATFTGITQDVDEYDSGVWSVRASLPSPARGQASGFAIGEQGYVTGGGQVGFLQDHDEYTFDSWASRSNCPSPARMWHRGVSLSGFGYIVGGLEPFGTPIADVNQYAIDSWASVTSAPTPREKGASTVIDEVAYLSSGYTTHTPPFTATDAHEAYVLDTWSTKAVLPAPMRVQNGAGTIGQTEYVFGGTGGRQNDAYSTATDSWSASAEFPSPDRNSYMTASL